MSEKESKNAPSFDYSGAIKEPIRKSAKWHFRRKPYEIKRGGTNAECKNNEQGKIWDKQT